jgi:hypothetical protein
MSALRREFAPLLRLAIPIVLGELGWMTMGIVDTMMVGRLSKEAMGGVSVGSVLFYAVSWFGAGLLLSMDALVSQAYTAEPWKRLRPSRQPSGSGGLVSSGDHPADLRLLSGELRPASADAFSGKIRSHPAVFSGATSAADFRHRSKRDRSRSAARKCFAIQYGDARKDPQKSRRARVLNRASLCEGEACRLPQPSTTV